MKSLQSLIIAELIFIGLIIVLVTITKKPKPRKNHREILSEEFRKVDSKVGDGKVSTFEENRDKYLEKIKSGKYSSKELACRSRYDIDQDFYQCLEEVYFS